MFYNAQYGFRTEHSTKFAALELTDRITIQMNYRNTPISILLDLSKAFDTLDHRILLEKTKMLWYNWNCTKINGKLYNKEKSIC